MFALLYHIEIVLIVFTIQAAKAYEKHCESQGKPASHDKAKELMAGFAGAFIDRMVETKGVSALALYVDVNDADPHLSSTSSTPRRLSASPASASTTSSAPTTTKRRACCKAETDVCKVAVGRTLIYQSLLVYS